MVGAGLEGALVMFRSVSGCSVDDLHEKQNSFVLLSLSAFILFIFHLHFVIVFFITNAIKRWPPKRSRVCRELKFDTWCSSQLKLVGGNRVFALRSS